MADAVGRGGGRQRALRVAPRARPTARPLYRRRAGLLQRQSYGVRRHRGGQPADGEVRAAGEAGITFLIGHEIGHHIQNINGRFHALEPRDLLVARQSGPEYVRRFELQADCLAGVWIHDSPAWATSDQFRADLLAVLADIGDDKLLAGQPEAKVRRVGLHGTTEQRTRWFLRGAQSGDVECVRHVRRVAALTFGRNGLESVAAVLADFAGDAVVGHRLAHRPWRRRRSASGPATSP